MKKLRMFGCLIVSFMIVGVMAGHSEALVFQLDCVIGGGSPAQCDDSTVGNFGTVTLTDTTHLSFNAVDITINLVDTVSGDPHKVLRYWLNFDETASPNIMSKVGYSVNVDIDDEGPNNYKGSLDIQVPDGGNIGFEPYSDTLFLSSADLYASVFNVKDTASLIYASVHIGNYGGSPGIPGGGSIKVGAKSVPELQTIYMLGICLSGIVVTRRKLGQ